MSFLRLKITKKRIITAFFIVLFSVVAFNFNVEEVFQYTDGVAIEKVQQILKPGTVYAQATEIAKGIDSTVGTTLAIIVGGIVQILVTTLGWILLVIVWILIKIANYNEFLSAPPIIHGWSIVRDVCNMFFVLILLIISFGTILRLPNYSLKQMLPKMILMAILINFSKTIAGLIIDFSQVIMLTFVNGFSQLGSANLTGLLGIDNLLSIQKESTENINSLTIVASYILALIYIIVAVIVVTAMVAVLAVRIVMLWIYVVLSPIAYISSVLPNTKKYADQWWGDFIKYVISGPILAFFIWLSFISLGELDVNKQFTANNEQDPRIGEYAPSAGSTEAGSADHMLKFIISISMLIGGLIMTQQLGGAIGGAASKGMGAIKSGAWKYTGARRTSERWGAFQGKRESARKAKAQATGERLYGAYRGALAKPKAVLSGVKATIPGVRNIGRGQISNMFATEKRKKKTEARAHIYDAYEDLKNKSVGDDFKRGGYTYTKTKSGLEVSDGAGNKVMKKTDAGLEYSQAYRKNMSPASQIKDEIAKNRVDKRKGEFNNLSTAELRRILESNSSSKDDKLASTMILAAKEGFTDAGQLQKAKHNLGSTPSLMKDFNESVNKRFGAWNHSIQDEKGDWHLDENAFRASISDGTIKVTDLDTSQLEKDDKIIDVIAKVSTTGGKFNDSLKSMARTDKDKENINKALGKNIEKRDFTGDDLKIRKAYAKQSGELRKAFEQVTTSPTMSGVNYDELESAIKGFTAKDIATIKTDEFDDTGIQTSFINAGTVSQIDGLRRSDESPEKLRKIISFVKNRKPNRLSNAIEKKKDDNDLRQFYDEV